MKLRTLQQELEDYFSKHYTKRYVEFGGYFHTKSSKTLSKSPMQKYFSSGKYKELNDPKLEQYWQKIKKREFSWNIVGIAIILVFYILNSIQD